METDERNSQTYIHFADKELKLLKLLLIFLRRQGNKPGYNRVDGPASLSAGCASLITVREGLVYISSQNDGFSSK